MNTLIVFSAILALSQASYLGSPYNGGLYAGYNGYAGYGYGAPYNGYAGYGYAAPAVYAVKPAPYYTQASQYQSQDGYGNVRYGYSNINSAKYESGNAYGGVVGGYSYVDAYGVPQKVEYVADGLGFRVKATNLPVAPAVPAAAPLVAPTPVEDTDEVKAAKAEFQAAFEEAENRHKRSTPAYTAPLDYGYAAPLAYNTYAAPVAYNTYAAPVAYKTSYAVAPIAYRPLPKAGFSYGYSYPAPAYGYATSYGYNKAY